MNNDGFSFSERHQRWLNSIARGSFVRVANLPTNSHPIPKFVGSFPVLNVTNNRIIVEGETGSRIAFDRILGKEIGRVGESARFLLPWWSHVAETAKFIQEHSDG